MESNGGRSSLLTRSFAIGGETGTNNKAKFEGRTISIEELCGHQKEGKLSPRYVGPFKIINRRGEVAYQLELPEQLSGVHDVFHVSQLKKCLRVPEEQLPLEELDIQEDLSYKEYPVRILEIAERITRSRIIRKCKVQWNRHSVNEAT